MEEMVEKEEYESKLDTLSSTTTPLSVLDWHRTRSESESSTGDAVNVDVTVPEKRREIKRRRLNGCSGDESRVHIFQRC